MNSFLPVLKSLIAKEYVFIPLVSFCIFIIFYLNADKILNKLQSKGASKKEEISHLLKTMFVDVNEKRIAQIQYLMSFGLGLIVFFILWPHFWLGLFIATIVGIAGWNIPLFYVKNLFDNRCTKLVDQMVDGLTIMSNGIKAGLTVAQAMDRVVENMPNPISQEFDLVLSQQRLGRSIEEALLEFGERVPKQDVQMFVTAINILKETGGNLGETFATIVLTIRERQKIEKKIEAMTSQGLTQAIIISFVPFILMGLFLVLSRDFIMPLFTTTLGLVIIFLIIFLVIIASISMRKIVKIEV